MALQKNVINIPIALGLDQKTDPFQVEAGKALALDNARFEKTGKLSKRFGLVALPTSSDSTAINSTTVSAVVSDNEYLAVKTSHGVYGYSEGSSKWKKQIPYVSGAKIKTDIVAINGLDQLYQDQDTTSDGTHTAFVCAQNVGSTNSVLVTLRDNSTGEIKTASISNNTARTVRVLCVKDSGNVRVHVFYMQTPNLRRSIYDEDLEVISSGVTITTAANTSQFDLCKSSSAIYMARLTTTSLELRSYSFNGTQTASNSLTVTNGIYATANTASGMQLLLSGSTLHLSWVSTTSLTIRGFNLAFATTIPESNISTGAVSYRLTIVDDGTKLYRVTDRLPSSAANSYEMLIETISYAGSYSVTSSSSIYRINLSSQLFLANSKAYFIGTCQESVNRNFVIYNASDSLMLQSFTQASAGLPTLPALIETHTMVGKVSVISGTAYVALPRRKAVLDDLLGQQHSTMSADLRFTSDYNDNSRVKIGDRIYLQDGFTLEVDKNRPHENNYVLNPFILSATAIAGVADPDLSNKSFAYQIVYEYYDAQGNLSLSAPSNIALTGTTGASTQFIRVRFPTVLGSLKFESSLSQKQVVAAIYRTQTGPGSVFYRVGQLNLDISTGEYADYSDDLSDSLLLDNQTIYTTGGVLPNSPAPSAEYIFSGGNRAFLVGLEEKDEIAYSKKQLFGESVAFNDFFRVRVSSGTYADKSPLNSGAYMDGKVILFRRQSIYFMQGDGPTETGIGEFSEPEIISSDAGCTEPRSVINTPSGVMFKSAKGIYLLTRGLGVEYIGAPVEDYNSQNICATVLNDKFNEARFYLVSGDCLVYNYLYNTWAVFKSQTTVDADSWQGSPIIVRNNTIFKETEGTYLDNGASGFYYMRYVTPWLKLDLIQGYFRVYRLFVIGKYYSAHTLKCRIYTDYDDSTYEEYSLVLDTTEQPQYQFQIHMPKQKVQSIKFELFDDSHAANSSGQAYDLTNIQVEMGMKEGGFKLATTKSY